jgi:hypothetical protein
MNPDLQSFLHAWTGGADVSDVERERLLQRFENDAAFRAECAEEIRLLGMIKVAQSRSPRWLDLHDALGVSTPDAVEKAPDDLASRVLDQLHLEPSKTANTRWFAWRPLTAAAAGIVLGMLCTSVVFGYSMPRLAQRVFELANPGFELGTGKLPSGVPRRVGIWSGDEVELLVRPDLKPTEGAQVLRFVKAEIQEGLVRSARSCDVFQLIDLRSLRDHIKPGEEAALELSADFLDARGAPGPTVRFACALMLFAGDPAELHTDWPAALDDILSAGKDQIDCGDGLAGRWHRLTARCVFPPGADFALLRVNVAQVNPVPVEFGQQFADNVKLVLKTHRALNMIAATGR